MKYNMKEIMTRAWEIKRENTENMFSLCLKMAWAEAKASKLEKTRYIANTPENRDKTDMYVVSADPRNLIVIRHNITTGTEKQITYARSILQKVCNKVCHEVDWKIVKGEIKRQEADKYIIMCIKKAEELTDAAVIIDRFKNRV